MALTVRPASQAGRFYEGNADSLRMTVDKLLTEAPKFEDIGRPLGLVSPHAGYMFSGQTAAHSYKQLQGHPIKRVVLSGPSHYVRLNGASIYHGDAYSTPLGNVELDNRVIQQLVNETDLAHRSRSEDASEHSLEVQLPFLQRVLDDFQLVPLMLGSLDADGIQTLAQHTVQVLEQTGGMSDTVFVASSDLYHGHSYDACKSSDAELAKAVEQFDWETFLGGCMAGDYMACGATAIALTMECARLAGATRARVLHQTNSRDAYPVTSGGYVVGYLSAVFD